MFLGVPLVLTPEETVLLVDIGAFNLFLLIQDFWKLKFLKGAAVLVDDPKAHLQPTVPQLERWSKEQEESIQTQLVYTEMKIAKESANASRAMSEEAQRKRKERELRKQAEAARKTAAGEDIDNPAALLASTSTESQKELTSRITDSRMGTPLPEGSNNSSIPYTIVIPASSSSLDWYDSTTCSYSTIEGAREAGVWNYPSDLMERARCGVFKDLWKQGYFMGGGIKFGGEYLVYPGMSFFISLYSIVSWTFFSRRSTTISLTFYSYGYRISDSFPSTNGDCGSWTIRYSHQKSTSFMRMGR